MWKYIADTYALRKENDKMTKIDEKKVEETPKVEEETKQEETKTVEKEPEKKEDTTEEVGYVKIRVNRAIEQTEKKLLDELGVENLDDAKMKLEKADKALTEVEKLRAEINQERYEKELNVKHSLMTKVLDEHKVFDSDALINYLDLDKVEVENGVIKDSDKIVEKLKEFKPNFFGTTVSQSDDFIKGQTRNQSNTALEKQKAGNMVGAIDTHLKEILKK